jgi:hypothetical protein
MGVYALVLLVILSGTVACKKKGAPTEPTAATTSTTTATTSTTTMSANTVPGCEITTASDGLPLLSDPKSPYFDNLGVGLSSNGITVNSYAEALAHASAPDATQMPDGSVGVYYNSGETGGIWLARLNGTSLSPVSAITVNGVLRPKWMSDVNVELVNGRVRMIYLNGESSRARKFCVAESNDGLRFQTTGLAMSLSGTEADPTVVLLPGGLWLMAYSRANHTGIGFARSGDGVTFAEFATATYGVVPELALAPDGSARLYVCAGSGVDSYLSSDAGSTWTREGQVIARQMVGRRIVCDPSYVPSAGVFILKTTDA